MSNDFSVKIGDFEGPLDLLLSLIESRKMHISDISLAQVADDYVAHVRQFENVNMTHMANFILVASTLMLIKSVSLLPTIQMTEEEKGSIDDLEKRLRLYKIFKDLGENVRQQFGQEIIFFREPAKNTEPVFVTTHEITKINLKDSILNVIKSFPKKELIPKTILKKIISLEEVIEDLTARIQSSLRMKFSEYTKGQKDDKISIIVSFLGMLELVKQGVIDVRQEALYEDIDIETKEPSVPRYG